MPASAGAAEGMFDLILSHITRNDNLALLGTYAARLRPGGSMLLSGFYTTEEEAMNAASRESGFILIDAERENEWSALRFARA